MEVTQYVDFLVNLALLEQHLKRLDHPGFDRREAERLALAADALDDALLGDALLREPLGKTAERGGLLHKLGGMRALREGKSRAGVAVRHLPQDHVEPVLPRRIRRSRSVMNSTSRSTAVEPRGRRKRIVGSGRFRTRDDADGCIRRTCEI
jgi:hypothetical protein